MSMWWVVAGLVLGYVLVAIEAIRRTKKTLIHETAPDNEVERMIAIIAPLIVVWPLVAIVVAVVVCMTASWRY